ncbi:MAG TPA: hypothetical protein VIH79_04600 [Candidatus Nanopelagicaceae bacterium]
MREKELLQIWNSQRSQRIASQLSPVILLATVLVLITTGELTYKSAIDIRAFAVGLVAAGGIFSISGILASLRDSRALTRAMKEATDVSQLGISVSKNSGNLLFTEFFFVILSIFNMTILALYLFKKP